MTCGECSFRPGEEEFWICSKLNRTTYKNAPKCGVDSEAYGYMKDISKLLSKYCVQFSQVFWMAAINFQDPPHEFKDFIEEISQKELSILFDCEDFLSIKSEDVDLDSDEDDFVFERSYVDQVISIIYNNPRLRYGFLVTLSVPHCRDHEFIYCPTIYAESIPSLVDKAIIFAKECEKS